MRWQSAGLKTEEEGGECQMKFVYFNDTGRIVSIHPATFVHGCQGSREPIAPLEQRVFILPDGTYPWVKMWDYGPELGLKILVSPTVDHNESDEQ